MVQLKNIITGVLSGAVFFMALQVGVAQEKAVSATKDKAEMKESIEAAAFAGTIQKLKAEFAQLAQKKAEVTTEKTKVLERSKVKLATGWFETNPDGTLKIPITEASPTVCNPSGTHFCAREYYLDDEEQPDEPTGNARKYNPL